MMDSDRQKYDRLKHAVTKLRALQERDRRNGWAIRVDRQETRRAEQEVDRLLKDDTIVKEMRQPKMF